MEDTYIPFTRAEALDLWAWLAAGWANSLDASGARTWMDGVPNYADAGGSFEGVTRMLWGLGSWLSYPDRPAAVEWRGRSYDLEALTTRALVNGCDPASLGYWGRGRYRDDWDQRTVETAQVAFALWQTRDRIWARMSDDQRRNVIGFLDKFGRKPSRWGNNWSLFWVLNHTARKLLGEEYDPSIAQEVMYDYLDGAYCGDGWYDDGETRGTYAFDDYNTWVFAMHVMAWAQMDGGFDPARRDELLSRIRAWMGHYPYFFGADGAYSEFGRSPAYKFCRLGAAVWAYKLGLWDHPVGMLRRLVAKHIRWYVDRGAVRPDGTLRQSLTATGSPEVIERYISTGAPYWAIQAFSGLWGLTDDDPFWTAEDVPLPSEQGDYLKVFPQPGWVVTASGGQVQRYNAGSLKAGYGSKYAKLVYSSRHPYNVGLDGGQPGMDSCLCLSEAGVRAQRERNLAYAVGESGWLRMRYPIRLNGHEHVVDTTVIPLGELHLRAHRIRLDAAARVGHGGRSQRAARLRRGRGAGDSGGGRLDVRGVSRRGCGNRPSGGLFCERAGDPRQPEQRLRLQPDRGAARAAARAHPRLDLHGVFGRRGGREPVPGCRSGGLGSRRNLLGRSERGAAAGAAAGGVGRSASEWRWLQIFLEARHASPLH